MEGGCDVHRRGGVDSCEQNLFYIIDFGSTSMATGLGDKRVHCSALYLVRIITDP